MKKRKKGKGCIALAALALLLAVPALAAEQYVGKVFVGANGVWYDGPGGAPSDVEAGLNGRLSLSPHISVVGEAVAGVRNEYIRGAGGIRITATDVNDPNFSISVGSQYHTCSDDAVRPTEWAADATLGWKPWPESPLILGAQGTYGFDSNRASIKVAARWPILSFWKVVTP